MHHRIPRLAAAATGLAALALAVTLAPAAAQADNSVDISVKGGDGDSKIICGNVATAIDEAEKKRWKLQMNNCKAGSVGGPADLNNVEIYLSQSAAKANKAVLAGLERAVQVPGYAADKCEKHRPAGSKQTTKCWAISEGGKVYLKNVTLIKGGVAQSIKNAVVPKGTDGRAEAKCWNLVANGLDSRDDCSTFSEGAWWGIKDVDVKGYGDGATLSSIDIDLKGGNANNYIACYNVTDGSGKVAQVNVCSAEGKGGNVTLSNVKIYVD